MGLFSARSSSMILQKHIRQSAIFRMDFRLRIETTLPITIEMSLKDRAIAILKVADDYELEKPMSIVSAIKVGTLLLD